MVESGKPSQQRGAKRAGGSARADHPGRERERSAAATEAGDLRGRVDQLGTIFAKGLDLAEAGVSLGVTVINRFGAVAQQQVLERMTAAHDPGTAEPAAAPAQGGEAAMPFGPAAPQVPVPEEQLYCITNRLPLAPGGAVRISFSINNDSLAEPKSVALRVEGFEGQVEGARIEAGGFAVKPSRKTIAPMDFDKFVLVGTVPADAPPDVYHGWVVVASGSELRIPIRLVAMSP